MVLVYALPACCALLAGAVLAGGASPAGEETIELEPYTVTVARSVDHAVALPLGGMVYGAREMAAREALMVDDLLRDTPGFSLFRRTSSRVAHPTTQGATLRGVGPSGAGRALVLLDGVPLNDAFGGWVHWGRLGLADLDRIEVVRGGGSSNWGSGALGGVIHMITRPVDPDGEILRAGVQRGERGTQRFRVAATVPGEDWGVEIGARHFETDGFIRVTSEFAGEVDIPATSRHQVIRGRADWAAAPGTEVFLRSSLFTEQRGNGTELTGNRTRAARVHTGLRHDTGIIAWQADAFADRTIYSSTFSSVSEDRSSESLALDQFRVPAHSGGFAFVASGGLGDHGSWALGSDWRQVRGETREWVVFPDRIRIAGGRQRNAGAFGDLVYRWGAFELSGALRIDGWEDDRGSLTVSDRETGEPIESEEYDRVREKHLSPRVGARWQPGERLTVRSAAYGGFRMPTLNERYRPFQVGSDRTFANAALRGERLRGVEAGADFEPNRRTRLTVTTFHSELREAIANVSIGPNPIGGEDRQRRNLAVLENQGIELEGRRQLSASLLLSIAYAWIDARIRRAPESTELEGNRTPQSARHGASAQMRWQVSDPTLLVLAGRYQGPVFEDDQNTRRLGGYTVIDLHLRHRLGERAGEFFVSIENLLDRHYLDGWTGDRLQTRGSPRWLNAGWSGRF